MSTKAPITGAVWDENINKTVKLIKENEGFLFGASIDPDSVGSMLSLALYLRILGKRVNLIINGALGANFDFLAKIISHNEIGIIDSAEKLQKVKNDPDVMMFFDTANSKLLPFYEDIKKIYDARRLPIVEFDHHFGTDSEELCAESIKLYRKANANTEIIAELLLQLHDEGSGFPHPFSRRNILLSLITGLLGDTVNGKVVHFKDDYDYWMNCLCENLKKETHSHKIDINFTDHHQIIEYLHALSEEQEICLKFLSEKIVMDRGFGALNLLNSTYIDVQHCCQPYDTDWFADVREFLLNMVPEKSGKVGILCYNGKDTSGADCIYIKMRRAVKYRDFDLREAENKVRETFGPLYMGGGGHAGAVSFRIKPHTDGEFLDSASRVFGFIKESLV